MQANIPPKLPMNYRLIEYYMQFENKYSDDMKHEDVKQMQIIRRNYNLKDVELYKIQLREAKKN